MDSFEGRPTAPWEDDEGSRSLFGRVAGLLPGRATTRRNWFWKGDVVTFTEGGFLASPKNRPQFSAKNYLEIGALRTALDGVHARRSLEIGCGYGRLSPWIAEYADEAHAVEPNEVALTQAREQYDHVRFLHGNARAMPYPDAHFDLLVSWTVLQHVPPEQIDAVTRELRRVLAPDATLVLCEAAPPLRSKFTWGRSDEAYQRLLAPWRVTRRMAKPVERSFHGNQHGGPHHPHDRILVLERA